MGVSFRIFAAAALAVVTIASAAQPVFAQGTKIIVVDNARVVRESVAGQDMANKIQAIGQAMQTELSGEATALETERSALESRTQNMTREAIAADTQLTGQAENFARKAQTFQAKRQVNARQLALTEQNALNSFGQALDPILQQIVQEQGADILLDRSVVAFAGPTVDVTDTVIARLNAAVPSIAVTRAQLPQQQAAPQTLQ
ncbi:MAG: OmpH family outer membrane protein [Pseudomonadota bacterium]